MRDLNMKKIQANIKPGGCGVNEDSYRHMSHYISLRW